MDLNFLSDLIIFARIVDGQYSIDREKETLGASIESRNADQRRVQKRLKCNETIIEIKIEDRN